MVVMVMVGMGLRTLENTWQLNGNFEEAEECLGQQFSELKSYILGGLPVVAVFNFFAVRIGKCEWKLKLFHLCKPVFRHQCLYKWKKILWEKKNDYIYCWIIWPGFLSFNFQKNVRVHCSWKNPWELSNKGSNEFITRTFFRLRFLALDLWDNLINATFPPLWTSLYMSALSVSPCPPASHRVTSG